MDEQYVDIIQMAWFMELVITSGSYNKILTKPFIQNIINLYNIRSSINATHDDWCDAVWCENILTIYFDYRNILR